MPGLDGRELSRRARVLRPRLPILLITGYATGDGADQAPDAPTLHKPFDRAALAAALAQLPSPGSAP